MSYQRIESSTIAPDLTKALRSEVGDPLWFLSRQWQVGELQGEDGGRAVVLRISSRTAKPTHIRGGPAGAPRGVAKRIVDGPLEPQVEAEARLTGPGRLMWSVRLGADALRRLEESGASLKAMAELREQFSPRVPNDLRPIDRLLCEQGVDGIRLAEAVEAGKIEVAQKSLRVLERWAREVAVERSVGAASGELSTWDPEHQEYQFHLSRGGEKPDLTLNAPEYLGRRADWFTFDIDRSPSFDKSLQQSKPVVDEVLASPIDFAGAPASRWWAIEDDEVSMAHLDGTDVDLARAIVAGFITTFGSDWLMAPVSAELGDLLEMSDVEIVDSFGEVHPIPAMADLDHRENSARPSKFFEMTGDTGPASGRAPLVYLAPTAADVLAGPDLERVVLARDELSNLGWAIEEVVESVVSRPTDRAVPPVIDEEPNSKRDERMMRYQLDPEVPEHWLPLVPVTRVGDDARWLQRGRVTPPIGSDQSWGAAQGLLLDPERRLLIHEEEVPRSGAVVTRRARATRQNDGTPVVWVGRRKRLGNAQPSGVFLPDQVSGPPANPGGTE